MSWAERSDDGAVATFTLTNPERLNAFDAEAMRGLRDALEAVAGERAVRAVILTGSGRAFCAGGDLAMMSGGDGQPHDSGAVRTMMRELVEVPELLRSMPKVTIAAVNGPCAGAGLALALACDLRVAASSAVFTTAFAKVGQTGDYGAAWLLSRLVGGAAARRLLLLSERISAEEARELGLVDELLDEAALMGRARQLAEQATELPPSVVGLIKANLEDAVALGLSPYLERECDRFIENFGSADSIEAVTAYLERRPPRYS